MLDVGTGEGVSLEGFDVEDDGNDVKIEPEASAKVRCLIGKRLARNQRIR